MGQAIKEVLELFSEESYLMWNILIQIYLHETYFLTIHFSKREQEKDFTK